MQIAILADIHGNLPALEAVTAELEQLQPDYVVVNGDLINGVPFSTDVIDRARRLGWIVIRGNHEFYYLDFGTERAVPGCEDITRWGQLHWLIKQITPEQGAYLATLPDERTFYFPGTRPIRIAHGVPGRNRVGFYNEQKDAEIAAELQSIREETVISAHTHVQIDRHVRLDTNRARALQVDPHIDTHVNHQQELHRHWHLINPGSVGLPLNGDTTAQFALLRNVPEQEAAGGWQATMQRVAYDRRPALQAYEQSGMMAIGGVITQLFYWELVTANPEIIFFYQWAWEHGYDPDNATQVAFDAYRAATGRDHYVRRRDPLYAKGGQMAVGQLMV
ncbi:MAG: metallophosphoesterase family protein [Caldilineaceae bacterium]|nr:metallophosphoesterase family protein [Caldilineaceae bacterium]